MILEELLNVIDDTEGMTCATACCQNTNGQRRAGVRHVPGKPPRQRERYYVPIGNGETQEVTREVYLCIYSGKRHEKHLNELDRKHGTVSLDAEAKVDGEKVSFGCIIPSSENLEDMVIQSALTQALKTALQRLSTEEWLLIQALFYQNIGIREYARRKGVTHRAVQKSRDRILAALRRELEGELEE